MKVEILEFIKDDRGTIVQGRVDVKITYDLEKWEIIRNMTYCKKDNGTQWLNMPSCKRGEKWFPLIDRPIELLKLMSNNILEELKSYLISLEPKAIENDILPTAAMCSKNEPTTDLF